MFDFTVLGTVFVDLKGFAKDRYDPVGRNLGSIQFIHGGVGRNVAENLGLLGTKTAFLSTTGSDAVGTDVPVRLADNGVDVSACLPREAGMGMWMVILDETGNQAGAISQMPDISLLEELLDKEGERLIAQSRYLALEIDLSVSIAQKAIAMAQKHGVKVIALPANMSVALEAPELLTQTDLFICNHIEAGRLFGLDTENMTPEELLAAAKQPAADMGIPALVVTMGPNGCVYMDKDNGLYGHSPAAPAHVVDVSGAGDSFFSGTCAALARGYDLPRALACGNLLASWTIQARENICPDLASRREELFV